MPYIRREAVNLKTTSGNDVCNRTEHVKDKADVDRDRRISGNFPN